MRISKSLFFGAATDSNALADGGEITALAHGFKDGKNVHRGGSDSLVLLDILFVCFDI